jgi:hypothetical protein
MESGTRVVERVHEFWFGVLGQPQDLVSVGRQVGRGVSAKARVHT